MGVVTEVAQGKLLEMKKVRDQKARSWNTLTSPGFEVTLCDTSREGKTVSQQPKVQYCQMIVMRRGRACDNT